MGDNKLNDDNDVIEILDDDEEDDAAKKLQELKKKLPFLNSVMRMLRRQISMDQYKKLEMLKELLERDVVHMNTLHKIDAVLGKLKAQFEVHDVVDMTKDDTEEKHEVNSEQRSSELPQNAAVQQMRDTEENATSMSAHCSKSVNQSEHAPELLPAKHLNSPAYFDESKTSKKYKQDTSSLIEARKRLAALRTQPQTQAHNTNYSRRRTPEFCNDLMATLHREISEPAASSPVNRSRSTSPVPPAPSMKITSLPSARGLFNGVESLDSRISQNSFLSDTRSFSDNAGRRPPQGLNIPTMNNAVGSQNPFNCTSNSVFPNNTRDPWWNQQAQSYGNIHINDPRRQHNKAQPFNECNPRDGFGETSIAEDDYNPSYKGSWRGRDRQRRKFSNSTFQPKTYREHREAKAKAKAIAAAAARKRAEAVAKEAQLDSLLTSSEIQLDTSYRDITLQVSPKKINFRIPKKTKNQTSNKTCDQKDTNGQDSKNSKLLDSQISKGNKKNKAKRKWNVDETEKHDDNAQAKGLTKSALIIKRDKNSQKKSEDPAHKMEANKCKETFVEKEASQPADDSDRFITIMEIQPQIASEAVNEIRPTAQETLKDVYENAPVSKVWLTSTHNDESIAQTEQVVVNDHSSKDISNSLPGIVLPELKRILKRRASMSPLASKPLINESDITSNYSLTYEDLQEQNRKKVEKSSKTSALNKALQHLYEETSDNCTVSTQNIITGKRCTRVQDLTLNEAELERIALKQAKDKLKSIEQNKTLSGNRKRGRPAKPKDACASALSVNSTVCKRNTSRRGRPWSGASSSGINRATFKAKKKEVENHSKTKNCLVRLRRLKNPMLKFSEPPKKNTNKQWHSLSTAVSQCVVCEKSVRSPLLHYMQIHGEFYGSRFPPGMLSELQASNLNYPLYGIGQNSLRYYHTCPFCLKTLCTTANSWIEHFVRHTGELNYACSKCLCPKQTIGQIYNHIHQCQPGAQAIENNFYSLKLPCRAYVCHICEFVQLNQDNVLRHYVKQHGFTEDAADSYLINITLYHHWNVPIVASKHEAENLENQFEDEGRKKYKMVFELAESNQHSSCDQSAIKIEELEEILPPEPINSGEPPIVVINAALLIEDREVSENSGMLEPQTGSILPDTFEDFDIEFDQEHPNEFKLFDIKTEPEPEPPLPKITVRRFTEDRLVDNLEDANNNDSVSNNNIEYFGDLNTNTTLRDLLTAVPREPKQPAIGELLSSKFPSHNESDLANRVVRPELGLVIDEAYSLADTTTKIPDVNQSVVTSAAVSPPPAQATQHYDAIPPVQQAVLHQANELAKVINTIKSGTLPKTVATPDKCFQCMAANCAYESPTVFCMRQHMELHRLSFGNSDYLQCAYCPHKANDVESYIKHGLSAHNLLSDSEQQQKMDAPNEIKKLTEKATYEENSGLRTDSIANIFELNKVVSELILPTGVDADMVYACPQKECNASLNESDFEDHVTFHLKRCATDMKIRCKYCETPVLFERPLQLRLHLERCHLRHSYFCGYCLATTVDKCQMEQHLSTVHNGEFLRGQVVYKELPGIDGYWMSLYAQPTKKEMDTFVYKLLNELNLRRSGMKLMYRPSEVHSLTRQTHSDKNVNCAECQYSTNVMVNMKDHLEMHLNATIRSAYLGVDGQQDADQPSADDTATQHAPPHLPIGVTNGEVKPGTQITKLPKYRYVPKEKRYVCGVKPCSVSFSEERAFRKHLCTQHSYSDVFYCRHCYKSLRGNLTLESVMFHMLWHKQHIYQCGSCTSFQCVRGNVERHIIDKHKGQDVDIIVHNRTEMYSRSGVARWLKPSRSANQQDAFRCNLCLRVFTTHKQIMEHVSNLHESMWHYTCIHCNFGSNDSLDVLSHIIRQHPNQRVQLSQVFHRMNYKIDQALGFYCNSCFAVASDYAHIKLHCAEKHQCAYQYKCAYCDFAHCHEQSIIHHMKQVHPDQIGLAVKQFESVVSELPDADSWNESLSLIKHSNRSVSTLTAAATPSTATSTCASVLNTKSASAVSAVPEVYIISSDEEENENLLKPIEFGCAHCSKTSPNAEQLRLQHYPKMHSEQPFYFNVQPQLRCAQCNVDKGGALALVDHLINAHKIKNRFACDTRRPDECAYCEHKFLHWTELLQHTNAVGHSISDLKYLTDAELNALLKLNEGITNKYFQCNICSEILPSESALLRHRNSEHKNAKNLFSFRKLIVEPISHCPFCMYASTNEIDTLRHMMIHYKKFDQCQLCQSVQEGGLSEYIKHCCDYHRMEVSSFRKMHPYEELKKFMVRMVYQFQNGLIISIASLRQTRYYNEAPMRELYEDIMRLQQQQ